MIELCSNVDAAGCLAAWGYGAIATEESGIPKWVMDVFEILGSIGSALAACAAVYLGTRDKRPDMKIKLKLEPVYRVIDRGNDLQVKVVNTGHVVLNITRFDLRLGRVSVPLRVATTTAGGAKYVEGEIVRLDYGETAIRWLDLSNAGDLRMGILGGAAWDQFDDLLKANADIEKLRVVAVTTTDREFSVRIPKDMVPFVSANLALRRKHLVRPG